VKTSTRPVARARRSLIGILSRALFAPSFAAAATAQQGESTGGSIEADGTVVIPSFRLPPSAYLSEQARAALPRHPIDPELPMIQALLAGHAGEMRARIGEFMGPRINRAKAMYRVETRAATLADVPVVYATPAEGVPAASSGKILLNLPGGGFVMGASNGTGMVESVPLARLAGVTIVSMTYRQFPEFGFPAASEDVEKVYRELLQTYEPGDIGIFGCSAGGMLTAESIAWFLDKGLPLPAAIGIFCASADANRGGDSRAYGRPFQALGPQHERADYFDGADKSDPLVSPIVSADVLRRFPPTLIITATRAPELSGAVTTHKELVKAGVDAELHVWDGLGHAFFYDPALPESREAFDVMARFFATRLHLGRPAAFAVNDAGK